VIVDGRGIPNESIQRADVCVIGAGPAGLFLADRLARLGGFTVAVLESGDLAFDATTQELAQGQVEGQAYFPLHETRIRCFGGASWSWGGFLGTLDPIDYEVRSWIPDSGWPLSDGDLTRYVDEALELCGFPRRSASAANADTDTNTSSMVTAVPLHCRGPLRFGREFARAFRDSERITVYLRSTVCELIAHESGAAVSGARVVSREGVGWTLSARVYVLASGGIENPRLLLASNRVHSNGLGNSRDLVGRYFMEHPRITDRVYLPPGARALAELPPPAAEGIDFTRLGLTAAAQRQERLLNSCANVSFGFVGQDGPQWEAVRRLVLSLRAPWNESPYLQFAGGGPSGVRGRDLMTALGHPMKSMLALAGGAVRPRVLRRYVAIESAFEQPPTPGNRVVLDARRDRLGIPLPRLQWTLDESIRQTYERGLPLYLHHLERWIPGLSRQPIVRGAWPGEVLGTWHHMGTTRMHPDRAKGVVDANCRVHDLANVYVAGSSVFPTGGAAAPTLTIIALALRLAEHLAAAR